MVQVMAGVIKVLLDLDAGRYLVILLYVLQGLDDLLDFAAGVGGVGEVYRTYHIGYLGEPTLKGLIGLDFA